MDDQIYKDPSGSYATKLESESSKSTNESLKDSIDDGYVVVKTSNDDQDLD